MYLDSVGKVTVGVGFMIPNLAALKGYVWSDLDAARADYIRLSGQAPANRAAAAYRSITRSRLLDWRTPLQAKVSEFERGLVRAGVPMDMLPYPAWEAVMDMAFNLGVQGLVGKFPTFTAAIRGMDLETAARECRRPQLSTERNTWTAQSLRTAQAQLDRIGG